MSPRELRTLAFMLKIKIDGKPCAHEKVFQGNDAEWCERCGASRGRGFRTWAVPERERELALLAVVATELAAGVVAHTSTSRGAILEELRAIHSEAMRRDPLASSDDILSRVFHEHFLALARESLAEAKENAEDLAKKASS